MSIKLFIATVATMVSFNANAQITGNTWTDDCFSQDTDRVTSCISYARRLADGLIVWQQTAPAGALACIPLQVDAEQLLDVGHRYLSSHPETRHLGAYILLSTAFKEAWPCKTK
jgi:hypothetical protein